jgi:hypothetical protein
MQEVDNVLRVLKETERAFQSKDAFLLKNLSNQTLHASTIYQDPDNIIVSVVVYVLGKILERPNYARIEGWDEFQDSITKNLALAINSLEKEDLEKFRNYLGKIRNASNKIDSNLREYIQDVFYKAQINKAFKIYEHGLSSEKTAELLGVSLWDLASYIGQTTISESHITEAIPVKERIKMTEEFFYD